MEAEGLPPLPKLSPHSLRRAFCSLLYALGEAPPVVMGEMGQHTANAGRIYFPSGTPDLADIRDGAVDIAGSVGREVEEETGIPRADYRASPHWDCVLAGRAVAMIRILQVDMPGEALRRRIEANLAGQQMPELSAIHLVRSTSDLTAAMPRFVTAFIESQFAS